MTVHHELKQKIMRRVYVAYVRSLVTHPVTVHIIVLAIVAHILAALVHVARVYESVMSAGLAGLFGRAVHVLTEADIPTLIITLLAATLTISCTRLCIRSLEHSVWNREVGRAL